MFISQRRGFALALPVFAISMLIQHNGAAQSTGTGQDDEEYRAITTAVPFVTITPDARAGGLGDAGTALSPDAQSIQYNVAKIAFADKPVSAQLSYTPWLRNITPDMFISLLSGYYKIRKQDAVTFGFTYFNLGSITFTDNQGGIVRDFNPQEFALSAGYSRQLTDNFSIGVATKYIYSNLTGGYSNATNQQSRPGQTVAVDLSAYYKRNLVLGGREANLAFAASLNNFGPKISYSNDSRQDPIPTLLRLGVNLGLELDPYNRINFVLDASKLAVPTPTRVNFNSNNLGNDSSDATLLGGFFSSFGDAPDGFSEELKEIMLGGGVEYSYNDLFALRGGYFHESRDKGGRQFFTAGVGLKYQQLGIDFSYLIPTTQGASNPLANTMRFTVSFDFNRGTSNNEAPAGTPGAEESVTD